MKSMAEAVALRDRAIQMLELAAAEPAGERRSALLHFVIVGANFTGAEVADELDALLGAAVKTYRHLSRRDIRITLIDRADRILSALDPSLSEYARANLVKRGVDV